MLRLNPKIIFIMILSVAIGYGFWLKLSLDSYRALSTAQAEQISTLQDNLKYAETQLTVEREATQKQTALEQAERTKLNDDEKEIKTALSAHDCAAVALPDGVIKRLQQ